MSTRHAGDRAAIGVQVGAAAHYLVQHRTRLTQPLYPAVFALVAFGTLAVADRLLTSRSAPKCRTGSSQQDQTQLTD
ncbi:hypothetical protein ACFWNL_21200 [Kitasatospora sp. NPDC058397]|uniref:hypothetical protein n=1 Tax=unclassified Kitasatospora TaxID=2633591 RepID=UPI0036668DC7